jgi:formyl-CoA transferase
MQESVINYGRILYAAQAMFGRPAPRVGNQSVIRGSAPSEVYPCKGGGPNDYCYVYTTRAGNHQWEALLKVIGREDLRDDPRFATPQLRQEHSDDVDAVMAAWTSTRDKLEVMRMLGEAGVPASAVFDTMELESDPTLRKRGMFVTVTHPVRGAFTMPGFPVKMSDSHVPVQRSPLLGEHNDLVFGDLLGVAPQELEALRQERVV